MSQSIVICDKCKTRPAEITAEEPFKLNLCKTCYSEFLERPRFE